VVVIIQAVELAVSLVLRGLDTKLQARLVHRNLLVAQVALPIVTVLPEVLGLHFREVTLPRELQRQIS
jgi:hypothetical protein